MHALVEDGIAHTLKTVCDSYTWSEPVGHVITYVAIEGYSELTLVVFNVAGKVSSAYAH